MSSPTRVILRSALWLLLGGWLGAWALFAIVVAPTAFRALPSTELAGAVVGPVLAALHLYGAGAGIALALIARALGRAAMLWVLPLLMSALCLVSHFGVTARIAELSDLAFGPAGSPEAAAHFALLHRVSELLFGTVGMAALALLGLHARADGEALGS
jgi:hypothetical protein